MVDANKKDETSKSELSSGKDAIEKDEAPSDSLNAMEEEDDDEDEYEEEEYEEEEEEEEEEDDEEEKIEEEKANDGGNAVAVVNDEGTETKKENAAKEDEKKAEEPKSDKKLGETKVEEPKSDKKLGETLKSKEKRPRNRNRKKSEQNDPGTLAVNGDKPESSNRKKSSKRVESMGMVFMCSSKTKADCFRYKILGLPESKKDQVLKIYRGMRLFLFDVDLRLMYGIFKAAGPGGYNIEPNAFKSEFPSQVRFTVLDDCLPLAEEKFKSVLKENYYSRNKFESLLKSDQVKKLCKLFMETVRGGSRSKSAVKTRRTRPIETRRTRPGESRRNRQDDRHDDRRDDRHTSRSQEKRKRRARDEERRPRSPPSREKRRYIDYERPSVPYDREPPVSRYHLPQPTAIGSPVRLYTYERPPLDVPPYIREHVPEPHSYRVVDRDRDPYLAYSREPPLYRDPVYPVPPEYHLVTREYHHPSAVPTAEYRIPGGSRVPSYRDVEIPSDYRSSAGALPEYRSRTHYNY